jgi:hypothetical protein
VIEFAEFDIQARAFNACERRYGNELPFADVDAASHSDGNE